MIHLLFSLKNIVIFSSRSSDSHQHKAMRRRQQSVHKSAYNYNFYFILKEIESQLNLYIELIDS